jgi:hypothetical protein
MKKKASLDTFKDPNFSNSLQKAKNKFYRSNKLKKHNIFLVKTKK